MQNELYKHLSTNLKFVLIESMDLSSAVTTREKRAVIE